MTHKNKNDKTDDTIRTNLKKVDVTVDTAKKIAKVVSAFVGLFMLYQLVRIFFFAPSNEVQQAVSENGELVEQEMPMRAINPNHKEAHLVSIDENEQVIVVVAAFRDDKEEHEDSLYSFIYDPATGLELQRSQIKIDLSIKGKGLPIDSPVELFTDAKNNLFLLVNKSFLYRFDKNRKQFSVVNHNYFDAYSEFSAGVAALEYNAELEGLNVITNEGTNYTFYPDLNKVYFNKAVDSVYMLPLNAPEVKTGYAFSESSTDFPQEKLQLIEYTQDFEIGYPNKKVHFMWQKAQTDTAGTITQKKYRKQLLASDSKLKARIKTYRDVTPEQFYFEDGVVLGFDEAGVIVALRLTEDDATAYTIQKINKVDGRIMWAKDTDWIEINHSNQIGAIILIQTDLYHVTVLGTEGEFKTTIDLNAIHLEVEDK